MPGDSGIVKAARARLRAVESRLPQRRSGGGPAAVRKAELVVHGRQVAYRTGGWGPLLVLLHGLTSSSATWEPVLPMLARRYTVLAPDLMGHGRSDTPREDYSVAAHANTIRDLMDSLGYRQATFVGHSLGAVVAMQVAYQYPERADRLVLVAPGGLGREISLLLRAASVPGSGPLLGVAASRPLVEAGTAVARLLGRLGLQPGTDLRELGRAYSRLADPVARGAFLQTLRSVVDREGQLLSVLPRLDVARRHPALIVWGDRDPVVPLRQGRQVHELVPNTYFAVFKNAGHFPHRDDPDRFVRAIDEFLAREWRLRGDGIALRA